VLFFFKHHGHGFTRKEQTLHTYLLTVILVVTAMGGMVSSQMCANQDWGNMHCTGGKNRWKCPNEDSNPLGSSESHQRRRPKTIHRVPIPAHGCSLGGVALGSRLGSIRAFSFMRAHLPAFRTISNGNFFSRDPSC